ncbi:caspase family protein [Algivirga pacifica]|uniref:Peptidase C14 caspase domain-containing protein n=1 Tax=Algivirga pacifica TaxID=1162670 RepID=A0ABP9DHI7_9BACT
MNRRIALAALLLVNLLWYGNTYAQTKRALLIGINSYEHHNKENGEWKNLEGAVNDATSMERILRHKYRFKKRNTKLLTTVEETTRQGIVEAFQKLIAEVEKGDIVLFYYAGHGARVKNSLYDEGDRTHEAIVPSDGALSVHNYILDVEINRFLSIVTEKGAHLTMIFDSCHSGSNTRASVSSAQFVSRNGVDATEDLKRAFKKPGSLADKGGLVMAAALDKQPALEIKDPSSELSAGAFTNALLKAMRSGDINEPAVSLFKRTKVLMQQQTGPAQYPVLEAAEDRRGVPLFGIRTAVEAVPVAVGISKVIKDNKGVIKEVWIDGGYADGLAKGDRLYQEISKREQVVLEVIGTPTLTSAKAKLVEGNTLDEAQLLKVSSRSFGGEHITNVHIPKVEGTEKQLGKWVKVISDFKKQYPEVKVKHNKKITPSSLLLHFEEGDWVMEKVGGGKYHLSKFSVEAIHEGMQQLDALKDELEVNFPVLSSIQQSIEEELKNGKATTKMVEDPAQAHYQLVGRLVNGQLEYAWISMKYMQESFESAAPVANMIQRSSWYKADDRIGVNLYIDLLQLSKIRSWLTLESPDDPRGFPYYPALVNATTNKVHTDEYITEGEVYHIALVKDQDKFTRWNRQDRYVYLLYVDSQGGSTLLYPQLHEGTESLASVALKDQNNTYVDRKYIYKDVPIEGPFGADYLFLMTTKQPIADLSIFQTNAMRAANKRVRVNKDTETRLRGLPIKVENYVSAPTWSVHKVFYISKPKAL